MKKILLLSAILLVTITSARAQLMSSVSSQKHNLDFSQGRDFWFALPSNQWGAVQTGTYINMYLTCTDNTIAYIDLGGKHDTVSIVAYQVTTVAIPESLEMESSGIVENKGIHVYDTFADLTVYFLSRQPASADGSNVIPTIGWGTNYVVAAYASLFGGGGSTIYDEPSECTIVADKNNTVVTIIPSCDCRRCTSGDTAGDSNSANVVFPQGVQFTETLNRGQSMQLMPVKVTGPDGFDMTGTIIHSSYPVGVTGGSMQPNIPDNFPYGDFVCSMTPSVRTWGETYYSTNFQQPPGGGVGHDFATYLFISSVPNQTISRHDCTTGDHIEAVISSKYGIYWDQIELGQKIWSDKPFLCVEYMNSATYPDGSNGLGDPAMAPVVPREQFTKSVVIETPVNTGSKYPDPYYNYANITVSLIDVNHTFFDGTKISSHPGQCIDGTWEIIPITNISAGVHLITGDDSGVGVYVYGYGYDESYAWSTQSFEGTLNSPDTIAPTVDSFVSCYSGFIHFSDSGNLQSGVSEIRPDSIYNMNYTRDADFIDGAGTDTGGYSYSVIDRTKPGALVVTAFDVAGNSTTVTTIYKPNYATIEPPLQNLGVWTAGNAPKIAYDTIYNNSQTPFDVGELRLKYDTAGFSIFDSAGGAVDLSPLQPGQRRLIKIEFQATNTGTAVDSILFGNGCGSESAAVIGNGGAPDFSVTSQTWVNVMFPSQAGGYQKEVTITNLSSSAITIDSAAWPDVHFTAVNTFPVTLPPGPSTVPFTIAYVPDSASQYAPDRTQARWYSHNVLEFNLTIPSPRYDSLIGGAAPPLGVQENNPSLEATILPAQDGRSLEIILPANPAAPANFELVNVLGQSVLGATFGTQTETIDASSLPRGVYFYRITLGGTTQMGKVILGQ